MRSRIRSVAVAALAFVFYSCTDNSVTGPDFDTVNTTAQAVTAPAVVISQVYGGGGSGTAGTSYTRDFIELHNTTAGPVPINGWSVGYASAGGISWTLLPLPSVSIPAGGYYLVVVGAAGAAGAALPGDFFGTPGPSMSGSAGKVVLLNSTANPGGVPCPLNQVDLVSYGTSATNCFGMGVTANVSTTTAAVRKDGGCQYTPAMADFAVQAAAPRNSATAAKICGTVNEPVVDRVSVTTTQPSTVVDGTSQFTATAYDAANNPIPGASFTWSSSNPAIATVNATGLATGKAEGDALIIATTANGKTGSASLHVDPKAVVASLVINEMMADPLRATGGASFGEWFEVYNYGTTPIDMNGWTIGSTGQATHTISSSVVVAPGGYAVLGRGLDVTKNGGVVIDYNYFNGNASTTVFLDVTDVLVLKNGAGATVDSVRWVNSTTMAKGATRALRDASVENADVDGSNWAYSTTPFGDGDLGTPDAANGTLSDTPPPVPNTISFSGRLASDPALPVGFEDQLFATERKGTDNSIIVTTFTWSSDTPEIATIDANGVMRGVSAGNAIFRATAADGTTNTVTLPVVSLTPGSSAQYANNTEFGVPTDSDASDDFIVTRPEFTASYSYVRNTPNWVAYNLEASHIAGAVDRCDCFTHDPKLPATFQVIKTSDYTGAGAFAGYGIDRGHLARSFDRTAAAYDNAQTYLLSNIVPQANAVNTGQWAQLENYLGSLATAQNKELYIIAGVAGNIGTLKGEGKVVIPAKVWKIAVIMDRDKGLANVTKPSDLQILAVIADNTPAGNTPWSTWETTVDAIEALSGYDFLAMLPNNIEAVVEGTTKAPIAEPAGPYSAVEGSPVAFNGSASSDPDGDVLTYEWSYGDGATGTGVTAPHAYADNGSYTAVLTVTDPAGANDVTDTPVTITNANPVVDAGTDGTVVAGSTYTVNASFSDAGTADSPWSYTITWGDGTTSDGSTNAQGGISASHTYSTSGSYAVQISVKDKDNGVGTDAAAVTVRALPVAATNGPFTSNEGSSVAMSGAASSDADGSIVSYAWNFGDGNSGSGAATSHTYAQDGSYTVTLTVTDNDGLTSTTTTSVTVANVGPAIAAISGATLLPDESYTTNGSFTDPGADSWTATVNYGDGSGTATLALSGKNFSLGHTYTAAGTYTVTVTVNDGSVTSTQTATVTVKTAAQGVQDVIALVSQFASSGKLSNGNANSLSAKLNAALNQIGNGNINTALNQLNAALNEIDALVNSGKLSTADANTLRAAINRVIATLS